MRIAMIALLTVLAGVNNFVQEIRGRVFSAELKPVSSATLILTTAKGPSLQKFAITDSSGRFKILALPGTTYILRVGHLSYETVSVRVDFTGSAVMHIDSIVLQPRHKQLAEIVIARKAPVVIQQDTVSYRADAYAGPDTRKVEDLLAKMPGFSVGSDGRLTYNGQVVERVMLDGDDLTGKAYQLLTRNLNAGYINKVEVILNDHENRLIKEGSSTGKVGVNLSFKDNFKGKWNAGLGILGSGNKRYEVDGHGVLVKQKIKLFSFANLNNIANHPLSDAESYEEMEDPTSTTVTRPHREFVLRSGELYPPDLPEKYVRDNKDGGWATMLTWKTGKHTAMRLVTGLQRNHQDLALESITQTSPDSSQSWLISNTISQRKLFRKGFLRWTATTDVGKRQITQYGLQAHFTTQESRYDDLASIAVSDSLRENLRDKEAQIEATWKMTQKLDQQKLMVLDCRLWMNIQVQQLLNRSSRYAPFFNLDPGVYVQLQDFSRRASGVTVRALLVNKGRILRYETGVSISMSGDLMSALTRVEKRSEDTSFAQKTTLRVAALDVFWNGKFEKWKKLNTGVALMAGPRVINWMSRWMAFPGGQIKTDLVYKVSQLQSIRFSWLWNHDFPEVRDFMPDPLISGDGLILGGIRYDKPIRHQLLQLGYYSNQLKQQLVWSVQMQWRFGALVYSPELKITPGYTYEALQSARGSQSLQWMGNIEKYVHVIRGKLGASLWGTMLESAVVINQDQSVSFYQLIQGEVWWAGVIGKRVKLESRLRLSEQSTALQQGNRSRVLSPGWSQKFSWQWSGKGFMSAIWRISPFGSNRYAQGLDAYVQQKIGKRWTVMAQGHNLLNQRQVLIRRISAFETGYTSYKLVNRYVLVGVSFQW